MRWSPRNWRFRIVYSFYGRGSTTLKIVEGKALGYGPALHGAGLISSPRFPNK
jgi:hypothetical protein